MRGSLPTHTQKECAVFVIVMVTLMQHSDLFGGIKGGIEAGEGTFPNTVASPASAHLSSFVCKKGNWGSRFKNLTCKMSWCAVENDHQ